MGYRSVFVVVEQKTAYEVRISDWSSDVCSSDLKVIWVWFVTNADIYQHLGVTLTETVLAFIIGTLGGLGFGLWLGLSRGASALQIGRASCRERVCQYV